MTERYTVFAKPGSKKGPLVEVDDAGLLTVYTRARSIDGQANRAVIELLAEYFKLSKGRVRLVRGQSSRHKVVECTKD